MSADGPRRRERRLLRIVHQADPVAVPYFDVSNYIPEGEKITLVEKGGFLMNPHVINEFAHKVIKKKNELVIFNCLIRFTLGFNRVSATASNTFIAGWTGLDEANIRKSLRSLILSGLVAIERPGTSSLSTVYRIPVVAGYLQWIAENRQVNSTPVNSTGRSEINPGEFDPRSKQPRLNLPDPSGSSERSTPVEATPKKENFSNKINEIQPSQQADLRIELYLRGVKPTRKQESERFFFQKLQEDFSDEDISVGLAYLQSHGVLGTKEPCHSPMTYLSKAGEDVIVLARAEALKRSTLEHKQSLEVERAQSELKRKEVEDQAFELAAEKFQSCLTKDEQEIRINEFKLKNYPNSSFPIPRNIISTFAAKEWFDTEFPKDGEASN